MGYLITAAVIFAIGLAAAYRFWQADRREGERRRAAEQARLEREAREGELRDQLERAREKKDIFESANAAVQADPVRAAKAVSTMMKDGEG